MRKAISVLMILALALNMGKQSVQKSKSENQERPKILPEKRHNMSNSSNTSRTESYTLYMEDSFGDGWVALVLICS